MWVQLLWDKSPKVSGEKLSYTCQTWQQWEIFMQNLHRFPNIAYLCFLGAFLGIIYGILSSELIRPRILLELNEARVVRSAVSPTWLHSETPLHRSHFMCLPCGHQHLSEAYLFLLSCQHKTKNAGPPVHSLLSLGLLQFHTRVASHLINPSGWNLAWRSASQVALVSTL